MRQFPGGRRQGSTAELARSLSSPPLEGAVEGAELRVAEEEGDLADAQVGVAEVLEAQLATHCVDGILEGGVVLSEAALEGASAEMELLCEGRRR
jgi:hypothetical protein